MKFVAFKKYKITKLQVLKKILLTLLFLLVFFASYNASLIYPKISPFAYALLFALVWCGFNSIWLSVTYAAAGMLTSLSYDNLYIMISVIFVVNIVLWVHKLYAKDKNIKLGFLIFYAALSQVPYIILNIKDSFQVPATIFSVFLGLVFLYCSCVFFKGIGRGKTKVNLDEMLCGSLILIIISMGLSNVSLYGIEFIKIVAVLLILIATYVFSPSVAIITALLMGMGQAIIASNPIYISVFVYYALAGVAFKTNYKVLSVVGIVLAEVVFGLYFSAYDYFEVLSVVSVLTGGIIFLLIPLQPLKNLLTFWGGLGDKLAIRNIVNRSKENVCRRMLDISKIFTEMDFVFRQMVKGNLSVDEAKDVVTDELVQNICAGCSEKNNCLRVDGEHTFEVLESLVDAAFEKGRATLLDVSQFLISRCTRLNHLINTANQLVENYKNYATMLGNMDASRMLIANQLKGVSQILENLAKEVSINIKFDDVFEERIKEELAYKNISCIEAVAYEQNVYEKNITLLIGNEKLDKVLIEKITSKIAGKKMNVYSIAPAEISNVSIVSLKTACNFDLVFGSATSSKVALQNGDSHSLIKIDNGKFMIALCDGMGSGVRARKTSELAVSLLENFYKAGFDNNIILSSVNKLLSLNSDENFSTLDLCVLDLRQNICDFIKLGTPSSYIKHKNSTEQIEGSGLPIGVLEEMQPSISKKIIQAFDSIILVTDGISDAFGNEDELRVFVNNMQAINPQIVADEILAHAKTLRGEEADDMTVFVVRVFPFE